MQPFVVDVFSVNSKNDIRKRRLETDTLEIQLTDDKVLFPWFTDHGLTGEADAYAKLVFAIAKLAVNQKRASAEEKQNDNEIRRALRLHGRADDPKRLMEVLLV